MLKPPRLSRERLDGTAVDIEFLLIAVIQGLALTTLAVASEPVIGEAEWIYAPYVLAGFVLILNFWALAIIHSISFISWPFDLVHTLLYFLVGFVEVAGFTEVTHPARWFVFMFVFFLVSALLYAWDMKMIREREREEGLDGRPARRALYAVVARDQMVQLRVMLPGALIFHGAIVLLLWLRPDAVLAGGRHLWFVGAQIVFGLVFLGFVVRDYGVRERLIADAAAEDENDR